MERKADFSYQEQRPLDESGRAAGPQFEALCRPTLAAAVLSCALWAAKSTPQYSTLKSMKASGKRTRETWSMRLSGLTIAPGPTGRRAAASRLQRATAARISGSAVSAIEKRFCVRFWRCQRKFNRIVMA